MILTIIHCIRHRMGTEVKSWPWVCKPTACIWECSWISRDTSSANWKIDGNISFDRSNRDYNSDITPYFHSTELDIVPRAWEETIGGHGDWFVIVTLMYIIIIMTRCTTYIVSLSFGRATLIKEVCWHQTSSDRCTFVFHGVENNIILTQQYGKQMSKIRLLTTRENRMMYFGHPGDLFVIMTCISFRAQPEILKWGEWGL